MKTINHLLLIDDSEATNNFHNRLLQKMNAVKVISTCTDGKEALEFINNVKTCPNLIFLDLNMPILDGFEFLEKINKLLEEGQSEKPLIVVLTSSEEQFDRERCESLYEKIRFHSKPLTIDQINQIWDGFFNT